jgi:hypothetical protein
MRCCILACVTLFVAHVWCEVRHITMDTPPLLTVLTSAFGFALFISSLCCFAWDWRLACCGLIISIPAMALLFLPAIAV